MKTREAKLPFEVETAYSHIEALAIPRLVETPGEEKAAHYILTLLRSYGLEPTTENVVFSDKVRVFFKATLAAVIMLLLLAAFLQPIFPTISIVFTVFVIAFGIYMSRNMSKLIWAIRDVGKKTKSQNIVVTVTPEQQAKGHIIVGAHYDSVSETRRIFPSGYLAYVVSMAYFIAVVLFSVFIIALSAVTVVGVEVPLADTIKRIASFVIAGLALPSIIVGEGNESPGAVDNASGVAVVLELARIFAKEKPRNVKVSFIAFGAEEQGLLGSISYLHRHQSELDPANTYVIIFDAPACRGRFGYNKTYGVPPRETDQYLNKLVQSIAAEREIETMSLGSPLGWGGDHMPFVESEFRATLLCTMSKDLINIIHSERDTLETVDVKHLEQAGIIGYELIRRIDMDLGMKGTVDELELKT